MLRCWANERNKSSIGYANLSKAQAVLLNQKEIETLFKGLDLLLTDKKSKIDDKLMLRSAMIMMESFA